VDDPVWTIERAGGWEKPEEIDLPSPKYEFEIKAAWVFSRYRLALLSLTQEGKQRNFLYVFVWIVGLLFKAIGQKS